ncbi:hypothetical protein [Streptomyces puniciscabiei]|uniref:hypothetical protein n=1 Tax=Streptomyces puniciscabiei TaxID=164348 RepID=UPI0018FE5E3C|nr:hypothetical protein [Streptomyces puniciscabiei]
MNRRLLTDTIDSAGVAAISRRFRLALGWLATGTLLGALLPLLGVAVIAAFNLYYWLPMAGEITEVRRRRHRGHRT